MSLIKLDHVNFNYNNQRVLQDITLEVERGDFLALIGPNGSGKTTLVKLILGLLKPVSGKIYLFGRQSEHFRERYRIGYLPQRPGLDNNFPVTISEVVATGCYGRVGIGRRLDREEWEQIDSVLQLTGLYQLRHRPLTELSGGQQQRAFIARALAGRPEVLIMDEPQVGLDDRALRDFYTLMNRLNQEQGITLVMVSHDVGAVGRHVNRVACLNHTLICHGTPGEVLTPETLVHLYGTDVRAVAHAH